MCQMREYVDINKFNMRKPLLSEECVSLWTHFFIELWVSPRRIMSNWSKHDKLCARAAKSSLLRHICCQIKTLSYGRRFFLACVCALPFRSRIIWPFRPLSAQYGFVIQKMFMRRARYTATINFAYKLMAAFHNTLVKINMIIPLIAFWMGLIFF